MRYMERIMKWFETDPGKTSLIDTATDRTMSYGGLDELTSKVYAYLSACGEPGRRIAKLLPAIKDVALPQER